MKLASFDLRCRFSRRKRVEGFVSFRAEAREVRAKPAVRMPAEQKNEDKRTRISRLLETLISII